MFKPIDYHTAQQARHHYFAHFRGPKVFEAAYSHGYTGGTPAGPLSIKCMFNGQAHYATGDGSRFAVDDKSFLILNQGQAYTVVKEDPIPVESFCIFFPQNLANDVLHNLVTQVDTLLEQPDSTMTGQVYFFERMYPHDRLISPVVSALRDAFYNQEATGLWLEEHLTLLLERMLHLQRNVYQEVEALPAARASTREELYRRLHIARDYIHACLHHDIGLNDIAEAAALSPHHFLRLFKQVFGKTPHQYLSQQRLERARYLLQFTDAPITSICMDVGFRSLGSFSSLFSRTFGMSPRTYRQQHQKH